MKRSLLIEEPPLQILPSLAAAIGLNEAIVLQQLYWLLQQPNNGKEVNGSKWIFNTFDQWRETYFPFWSVDTIQRAFESLHAKFIVETCQPEGRASRRKYYRLNMGALERLNFDQLAEDRRLRLSGKGRSRTPQIAAMGTPQLAVIEEGNMHPSLDTKTSSETSSKTSLENKPSNTLKTPPEPSPNMRTPLPQMPEEWRDELTEPWQRFLRHCAERHRPVTPTQAATIFAQWEEIPSYAEIKASIELAITTGNTGLIRAKSQKSAARTDAPGVTL